MTFEGVQRRALRVARRGPAILLRHSRVVCLCGSECGEALAPRSTTPIGEAGRPNSGTTGFLSALSRISGRPRSSAGQNGEIGPLALHRNKSACASITTPIGEAGRPNSGTTGFLRLEQDLGRPRSWAGQNGEIGPLALHRNKSPFTVTSALRRNTLLVEAYRPRLMGGDFRAGARREACCALQHDVILTELAPGGVDGSAGAAEAYARRHGL